MSIKNIYYFGFQGMDKNTDHKPYIAEIQHKYIQRSRCKGQREDNSAKNVNSHQIIRTQIQSTHGNLGPKSTSFT